MTRNPLHQPLKRLTPFLVMLAILTSPSAGAENIDVLMNSLFPSKTLSYIGYTSVERQDVLLRDPLDRKFLIVDFRFQSEPVTENLQASIHTICMAMIRDRDLMQKLARQGYDMVSVAFDRRSQYDCL